MKKLKKSYIIIFILVILSIICFGTSYAIFMNTSEYHGKLNIVVGDLTYKIESDDLENRQITVGAGEIKEIKIKLSSLNEISSKYELYYTLDEDNSSVRVGYDVDTKDSILGTVDANSTKTITIIIRNESDTNTTVTFSVTGGLVNNELVLTEGNSLNQVVGKYTAYSIGDEITLTDGSKWHVLEASDETVENVVLLSDYNLNSDGSYNDECGRDINSVYTCSTMAFDTDNTNVYDEEDSNNIGYFIKNIYAPKVISSLSGTTDVTLPTTDQIAIADGKIFNQLDFPLTPNSWLLTTNYWTMDIDYTQSSYVWYVNASANGIYAYYANTSTHYGARPTITTLKSNIVKTMSSTTELTVGTSVEAIDGSKWHVLEASDSDSKYVTLLSDYNLNSDGTYNTECQGITDNKSSYRCSPIAFDEDNINTYDETDSNNIGYFIQNTYSPLVISVLLGTKDITLPTIEQISDVDGVNYVDSPVLISTWLSTTNYWTKSPYTSNTTNVWFVGGENNYLYNYRANDNILMGARPVITTLKSNLLND